MAEQQSQPLACPKCALRYPLDERFCKQCGMPLTYAGRLNAEEPVDERHERARKINPVYSRGELRKVATGRQQPEAELIQMLLLDEGVPSTLRRSAGFDVPDMLAAGPRDVLVPESGVDAAREVLMEADLMPAGAAEASGAAATGDRRSAALLLLGILLGAVALGVLTTIVVIVQNN